MKKYLIIGIGIATIALGGCASSGNNTASANHGACDKWAFESFNYTGDPSEFPNGGTIEHKKTCIHYAPAVPSDVQPNA